MIEESRDCAVHAKACCATPRGVAQGALRPERSPGIASSAPHVSAPRAPIGPTPSHPLQFSAKALLSRSSPIPEGGKIMLRRVLVLGSFVLALSIGFSVTR